MHRSEAIKRSMRGNKGRDTKPELALRKALYHKGFRYRINDPKLPGRPDIVMRKYRAVIFVHGCFWHMHQNCPHFRMPTVNQAFWLDKFERNKARDQANVESLKADGWRVLIVWECALQPKNLDSTIYQVMTWLTSRVQAHGNQEIAG